MWEQLQHTIQPIYRRKGIHHRFVDNDCEYLYWAFTGIEDLWTENYNQIKTVNHILFAEAPLWGIKRKYIYNPETKNSQFFYRSDLEYATNRTNINTKQEFLDTCNSLGLLVVDLSPFALNPNDTGIHYRKNSLKQNEYRELLAETFPIFLQHKLDLIRPRLNENVNILTRYVRVHNNFSDLIFDILVENQIIQNMGEINCIGQLGGGINRPALRQIINPNNIIL